MKKNIIFICVGIVLIIVAGLIIFVKYQSHSAVPEVKKETISTSTPVSAIASSTISQHPTVVEIDAVKIDKNDWQTYENKQYGYKISAPKDWIVSFTSSDKSLQNGGSMQIFPKSSGDFDIPVNISASENVSNLSLEDWIIKAYSSQGAKAENLNKVDIPTSDEAMSFYSQDSIYGRSYSYFVKKGNLIYEFDPMTAGMGSNILNEDAMMKAIVETFRFAK